jgi:thiamine-phosphate pyrophosphorylase
MKDRIASLPLGLYVIIDPEVAGDRPEHEIARQAIEGGARLVQLRDKQCEKGLQLPVARRLKEVCARAGVPLIINDHLDLALAVEADGVHVGQKDLPVSVVRRLMPGAIIGCSTNNVEEALRAQADGASYVSVGRLFPTDSKADTRPATLETLRAVKQAVHIPVAAIGGITEENIDAVLAAGADLVVVIGAVVAAPDVREAARRLAERISERQQRTARG